MCGGACQLQPRRERDPCSQLCLADSATCGGWKVGSGHPEPWERRGRWGAVVFVLGVGRAEGGKAEGGKAWVWQISESVARSYLGLRGCSQ